VDRANCNHGAKPERFNKSVGAFTEQQCVTIYYVHTSAIKAVGVFDCRYARLLLKIFI
jgi:hypothetical protein